MLGKLESIQIVRALAALMVVLFHSHYLVDGFPQGFRIGIPFIYAYGYWGVEIFFVVSGFIIAGVTSKSDFTLWSYFIKRFFRIYPIYWIFCYLSLISYYKFGLNIGQSLEYATIYASFLTAPIANSLPIYPVGWTLTYEVFFYLIAGIVILFTKQKGLILVLLTLGLVGLATQGPPKTNPGFFELLRHTLTSPYQIHFAAGVFVFCYQCQLTTLRVIPALMLAVASFYIALALLAESAVTLGVCLGASLFIIALLNAEKSKLLQSQNSYFQAVIKMLVSIGNASFSLYLVHWIVFRWMGYEKTLALLLLPAWSAEMWRYFGVLMAVGISLLLHRFLEVPVIGVGNYISNLVIRAKKRRSITAVSE
jgi:exopolysaccharide production protein ExoZ